MATQKERIISKEIEILNTNPDGVRCADLIRKISKELPDVKVSTIRWIIWDSNNIAPDEIHKPERGLFVHTKFGK